jgi:DHA1 family multidrug resistance protein-like MFS transporter
LGGVVKDWLNITFSFLSMAALTLLGFLLCVLFLPSETEPNKKSPPSSGKSIPYLKLMKTPSVFSLFTFRACFTTCIGITWTFLPLLASAKLHLSSSAIGILVMINVCVAGLFQVPMGYLADRFSKRLLVIAGGILAAISIFYLNMASSFGELALANGVFGLAGGISFPAIMALGVIEGRRTGAMGSLMGLLAMAHSVGMLAGPLLAGGLLDIFSFSTIFIMGALILAAGTIVFVKGQ